MKRLLFLIFFIPLCLLAIQVPFSIDPIKTDTNHISGMDRISPPDKLPIHQKTDTWFWHDGKNLYAYWEMEIDSRFYPGAYATRDDNQQCDYIRLQIKTITNEDFAYYFSAFPRGTSHDAVRNENLGVDKAWNSLYDCKSEYTDKEWKVTMIIPFKDLRYEGNPPYRWSFSTARQIDASNTIFSYPYTPITGRTVRQYYDSFEVLEIKESIDPPKNYTVIPYFYHSYDIKNDKQTLQLKNGGLNIVYRPSKNTSCKLSFNPDFTETPVDEERDSRNDKYAPRLTENRIFFTEDLNAFGVTSSQFYSRNIMQPQYAAKITSSGSNWSFGFLSAKDKKTLNPNSTVANPDDYYNIVAYKNYFRNISNQFTYLNRFDDKGKNYNHVLYWSPNWDISQSFNILSRLTYTYNDVSSISASQKQGTNAEINVVKRFDQIALAATLKDISKYYYAAMGAQSDINLTGLQTAIDFDQAFSGKSLRTFHIGLYASEDHERNKDFKLLANNVSLQANADFFQKYGMASNVNIGRERINNKLLNTYNADYNFNWSVWLICNGYVGSTVGKGIYRRLGETKSYQSIYGGINGFVGPVISYIFRNNHIIWKDLPSIPAEYGIHLDNEYDITNLDMELTFSNTLKIVSGVRYNNNEDFEQNQHLGYFSTIHWLFNPSTTLYLGFKTTEDKLLDFETSTYENLIYKNQKTSQSVWFKINKVF